LLKLDTDNIIAVLIKWEYLIRACYKMLRLTADKHSHSIMNNN